MMNSLYYFSYGSNMSSKRLSTRVPSAKKLCLAYLEAHQLRFHKRGRDDSAKCDAHFTGKAEHFVIGVVFEIAAVDRPALDNIEGPGYEAKRISVVTDEGETVTAFTYVATHIDKSMKPYHWYKEHVLIGAREHQLPDDYIALIDGTSCMEDNDVSRIAQELGIYR